MKFASKPAKNFPSLLSIIEQDSELIDDLSPEMQHSHESAPNFNVTDSNPMQQKLSNALKCLKDSDDDDEFDIDENSLMSEPL